MSEEVKKPTVQVDEQDLNKLINDSAQMKADLQHLSKIAKLIFQTLEKQGLTPEVKEDPKEFKKRVQGKIIKTLSKEAPRLMMGGDIEKVEILKPFMFLESELKNILEILKNYDQKEIQDSGTDKGNIKQLTEPEQK